MSKRFVAKYFPESKSKWKAYFKLLLPMMAASTLFAFNGFVDNFMVGHIEQGGPALSAVNAWTNIIMGVFVGIATAGSISMVQFYYAGNEKRARDMSNLRFSLSFGLAIALSIAMLVAPKEMSGVFLKEPSAGSANYLEDKMHWDKAMDNAVDYSRIIVVQWVLMSLTFNFGNQFRELGHAKVTMYWGIGTLATNITFNSVFMYGLHFGVEGAAIATVAARCVALTTGIFYGLKKKLPVVFTPWKLFVVQKVTWKAFWSKWYLFFSASTTILFINLRLYFYDDMFPIDSLGKGIGATAVLALTGSIMNVFMTTFNALATLASNFVGSELGKGNIKQAKINSNEIRGFATLVSTGMSIVLTGFAFVVPYMMFLSEDKYEIVNGVKTLSFDGHANLIQIRNSLWVIALYYPIWIWFSTAYKNSVTGGKAFWFALIDWVVAGPVQLLWLYILTFVVRSDAWFQEEFYRMYFLFFLSDLLKLVFFEIAYHKVDWAVSITKNEAEIEKHVAEDEVATYSQK